MSKEKKKVGRPKFKIDYEAVRKLAAIMCTQEEIASFLGCSVDTLQRDETFCGLYKEGRETGKMSLRRMQFKHAEKNPQMAMFLGKVYLKQRENAPEGNEERINEVKEFLVKVKEVANDGTSGDKQQTS